MRQSYRVVIESGPNKLYQTGPKIIQAIVDYYHIKLKILDVIP
jgi:hypothetical protein